MMGNDVRTIFRLLRDASEQYMTIPLNVNGVVHTFAKDGVAGNVQVQRGDAVIGHFNFDNAFDAVGCIVAFDALGFDIWLDELLCGIKNGETYGTQLHDDTDIKFRVQDDTLYVRIGRRKEKAMSYGALARFLAQDHAKEIAKYITPEVAEMSDFTDNCVSFRYLGYTCFIHERQNGTWHSNLDGGCGPQRFTTFGDAVKLAMEDCEWMVDNT